MVDFSFFLLSVLFNQILRYSKKQISGICSLISEILHYSLDKQEKSSERTTGNSYPLTKIAHFSRLVNSLKMKYI